MRGTRQLLHGVGRCPAATPIASVYPHDVSLQAQWGPHRLIPAACCATPPACSLRPPGTRSCAGTCCRWRWILRQREHVGACVERLPRKRTATARVSKAASPPWHVAWCSAHGMWLAGGVWGDAGRAAALRGGGHGAIAGERIPCAAPRGPCAVLTVGRGAPGPCCSVVRALPQAQCGFDTKPGRHLPAPGQLGCGGLPPHPRAAHRHPPQSPSRH